MLAIISTLLALAVLLVIVGLILPSRLTVERSLTIDQPAEKIFPWAADLKLWPRWTVWNAAEDPSLAYTYSGPTTGLGGAMAWTAKKMGDGTLKFTHFEENKALHYELVMPAHGTRAYGELEFESAGGGATRVTWLDEIDLGGNPFKRLLGPMLKKILGHAFARNLQGLKTAAMTGQAAGPGPK
jgi:uncharacterized membrane protein